jgi:DNA-binding beta-propeller fold protein YncE
METNIPVMYLKTFGESLLRPYGITIDRANNIYVAEASGGRITKFDQDGRSLMSFGEGEGSLFKKTGRLGQPAAVAVDASGFCYVADFKKNCIFIYDPQGHFVKTFGTHGREDGQFIHCLNIKTGPDGGLWVVDRDNHRVQKFDTNGNFLLNFGKFGRDKDGSGCFDNPSDIAFDSQGFMYVTDELNSRVQKFDSHGNFISIFGKTATKEGILIRPRGIAIDGQDRVYVTDSFKDVVIVFDGYGRYLFYII